MDQYEEFINSEIRSAFKKGVYYAAWVGMGCGLLIGILILNGMAGMMFPFAWSLSGGCYSLFVYIILRKDLYFNGWQYILYLPFTAFPSILFILTEINLPGGAATYFFGPPVFLYFVMTALSGILFHRGVSIFAGILSTIQYIFFYYLAQDVLHQITAPDPVMQQDFSEPVIYLFRAIMILATGFIIGVSANSARKLFYRVLHEQNEKQSLDRLFGQYVSHEVKNKIIQEKKEMLAERKNVVVLFSDLRSFSTFSERMQPEDVVLQLNEYFEKMVQCIVENGGTVDKFIGDAIMAVFGGLVDLENPSENALMAATNMFESLHELNLSWENTNKPALQMGIGLHYGEVLEGTIGSKTRKEFTVMGDTVNTAARLESEAKNYEQSLIISQRIWEKLNIQNQQEFIRLGNVQVKGKSEILTIYGK